VLIRNRRKHTILDHVKRHIKTVWIDFSEAEKHVYDTLSACLLRAPIFAKLTYLKELCSSREACYLSLQKKEFNNDNELNIIMNKIAQLPHHAKAKKLIEIIKQITGEKIIVFTQYRATQYYLQWYLQQHGIAAIAFYGGLKRGRKDWIKQLFKEEYQVLIATAAGGEGINLQFCHHLINYDLPWNPMHVEQRIGRIHRYGQKNNVHIYNFAIKNTLEEELIQLLYKKIAVFERVIGEVDDILERLQINSIEKEITNIIKQSDSVGEARIKCHHLFHIVENEYGDEYENEGIK